MRRKRRHLFLYFSLLLCILQGMSALASEEKTQAALSGENITAVEELFTPEEKEWLEGKKVLRVAVTENWRPYIYKEKRRTGEVFSGLAADLLQKLEEESGIGIEYIVAGCYADMIHMLSEGKADVAACVMENGKRETAQDGFVPYLEAAAQLIAKKDSVFYGKSGLKAARVEGTKYLSQEIYGNMAVTDYKTLEESLEAVRKGKADFAVCDIYTATPLLNRLLVSNLTVKNLPECYVTAGFLTASEENGMTASILEKVVASMSTVEISERLFLHGEQTQDDMGIIYYIYRHPFELLFAALAVLVIITGIVSVYVRSRLRQQRQLREYEESYRMLSDTFGYAGMEYDYAKDRLVLFGERHGELDLPETVEKLHEKLHNSALRITLTEEQFDRISMPSGEEKTYEAEFQCGIKEGGWNWFRMIYIIIREEEPHRKPLRLVGCLMDAQKQHATEEKLVEIGQYDKLTGIYNRAGAEGLIRKALRHLEEYSQNVFLLMDVDRFKQMNDSNGHLCGDDVLRTIGKNLKEIFEGDTILCRWGGDEFIMFVRGPGAEKEILRKRIEELRTRMKNYKYEEESYPIGVSIGGVVPSAGMKLEKLFQEADEVLYCVKEQGRDSFMIREAAERKEKKEV